MTVNLPSESQNTESFFLKEQIQTLIADLWYPSESDEKIEYFEMALDTHEKVSQANFRMFNGITPDNEISEMNIDDFFKPLVKIDDWFGEEEKKWANDAQTLQNLLTDKLKDIQIFRVGRIAIDIYLFGKAEDCLWVGLKTKVVET